MNFLEPFKIVLTGGPSAGKTSIIEELRNHLFKGAKLLFVSETATDLMKSGIKVSNMVSEYDFQKEVCKQQLAKEEYYKEIAAKLYHNNNVVIIYDRGLLDGVVYIDEDQSREIFANEGLILEEVHHRYNLIIHLESSSKNIGYTTENNSTRRETEEEAKKIEDKTFYINKKYVPSLKLCFIPSCDNFEEKVKEVIELIEIATQ